MKPVHHTEFHRVSGLDHTGVDPDRFLYFS